MKVKTSELKGAALDYAASKAKFNRSPAFTESDIKQWASVNTPSLNWEIAGPIIEREGITTIRCDDDFETDAQGFTTLKRIPVWCATYGQHGWEVSTEHQQHEPMYQIYLNDVIFGSTYLVAAMRCYVLNKLGDKVEIPDELV